MSPETDNAGEYRVVLQKQQLVFSAAHFITFNSDICECLHGHNYGVIGEVVGPSGRKSLRDRFHRVSRYAR
jgi:hypothetical protein